MCNCNIGPGKFEGEPALTFLAYHEGFGDASTEQTEWFRGPFTFSPQDLKAALEYGYCDACIIEALTNESYGLSVYESDQGFVYLTCYGTSDDFDTALAEAEADDAATYKEGW